MREPSVVAGLCVKMLGLACGAGSEEKDFDQISEGCTLLSRCKESGGSSEDSSHIRFFSFSLIEGYISLVMDEQTTQRSGGGEHHTTQHHHNYMAAAGCVISHTCSFRVFFAPAGGTNA